MWPYLKQSFDSQLDCLVVSSNGFICVILLQELSHSFCATANGVCLIFFARITQNVIIKNQFTGVQMWQENKVMDKEATHWPSKRGRFLMGLSDTAWESHRSQSQQLMQRCQMACGRCSECSATNMTYIDWCDWSLSQTFLRTKMVHSLILCKKHYRIKKADPYTMLCSCLVNVKSCRHLSVDEQ